MKVNQDKRDYIVHVEEIMKDIEKIHEEEKSEILKELCNDSNFLTYILPKSRPLLASSLMDIHNI